MNAACAALWQLSSVTSDTRNYALDEAATSKAVGAEFLSAWFWGKGPMHTDEVEPGVRLTGLASGSVTVVAATPVGDALQITVRDDSGHLFDQVLFPEDLPGLRREASSSRWSFDADPAQFRLAAEALRMRHAGLSDPMLAVETSDIDPLPHQIRAVYGTLLAQAGSLRFLLADDPGAGKTIMAGLYLKELLLRGDVQRCLIVAPVGWSSSGRPNSRRSSGSRWRS